MFVRVNKKSTHSMELWRKAAEDFQRILNLSVVETHKSNTLETFINKCLKKYM